MAIACPCSLCPIGHLLCLQDTNGEGSTSLSLPRALSASPSPLLHSTFCSRSRQPWPTKQSSASGTRSSPQASSAQAGRGTFSSSSRRRVLSPSPAPLAAAATSPSERPPGQPCCSRPGSLRSLGAGPKPCAEARGPRACRGTTGEPQPRAANLRPEPPLCSVSAVSVRKGRRTSRSNSRNHRGLSAKCKTHLNSALSLI